MITVTKRVHDHQSLKVLMEIYTDPRKFSPLEIVNQLRRTLLSDIPTVAIDTVIFYINETYLANELLQHRLQMIPVFTEDPKITLTIDVMCDPNEFDVCPVMSDYIIPNAKGIKIMGDIIITHLAPGKSLKCEILLRKSTGKEDIRFSPVSIVYFNDLSPQKYEFTMETVEGHDPEKIFKEGMRILMEKPRYREIKYVLKNF